MARFKVYQPIQQDMNGRLEQLNKGNELWLAIEGRFTNLRIWKSRIHPKVNPDNTEGIYMRLDCAKQYSVPLSKETFAYLQNPHPALKELVKFYFPTSVDNLQEILEITKDLIIRHNIVEW